MDDQFKISKPEPVPPKNPASPYYDVVRCNLFFTELIVPNPSFVWNPVTLTIKLIYSLNFVDSRTKPHRPEIIWEPSDKHSRPEDGHYVIDSNNKPFRSDEWDFTAQRLFATKFKKGEEFWDRKFMLITPDEYSGFDYQLPDDVRNGTSWRPNVQCRFELISIPNESALTSFTGSNPGVHLTLDVVRARRETYGGAFRSNIWLYDISDVDEFTLWHEIGHAMGQDHIQALLGNGQCIIGDSNATPCYVTPKGVEPNIMGNGKGLLKLNALPWVELIQHHTKTFGAKWEVSRNIVTPPRKIPGVQPKRPVIEKPADPTPSLDNIDIKNWGTN